MVIPAGERAAQGRGPVYTFIVDEREFEVTDPTITGGEIMDLAGIPHDAGLVQILDDGTQRTVAIDEVIELRPGHAFKKRPKFKRG